MTWRWLIFSSLAFGGAYLTPPQPPATSPGVVTGEIEITNSKEPAVRRNKDYSGVVIWLEALDHDAPKPTPRRAQMVQKDRHFLPHVLAVSVGSTVDFPNRDPIYHNAFSNFSGTKFDIGLYPPGTSRATAFTEPGIVRVYCNIHPTMSAIIAVMPVPWYAVSTPTGKFSISNVPPGEYRIHFFYERALPDVLRFLEHPITVPAAGLSLPLISISETGFIQAPHLNKFGKPYPPTLNESTYPGAQK